MISMKAAEAQAQVVVDAHIEVLFDRADGRRRAAAGLLGLGEEMRRVDAVLAVAGDGHPQVARDGEQPDVGLKWVKGRDHQGIGARQGAGRLDVVDAHHQDVGGQRNKQVERQAQRDKAKHAQDQQAAQAGARSAARRRGNSALVGAPASDARRWGRHRSARRHTRALRRRHAGGRRPGWGPGGRRGLGGRSLARLPRRGCERVGHSRAARIRAAVLEEMAGVGGSVESRRRPPAGMRTVGS